VHKISNNLSSKVSVDGVTFSPTPDRLFNKIFSDRQSEDGGGVSPYTFVKISPLTRLSSMENILNPIAAKASRRFGYYRLLLTRID
jgi:hypothetical protein